MGSTLSSSIRRRIGRRRTRSSSPARSAPREWGTLTLTSSRSTRAVVTSSSSKFVGTISRRSSVPPLVNEQGRLAGASRSWPRLHTRLPSPQPPACPHALERVDVEYGEHPAWDRQSRAARHHVGGGTGWPGVRRSGDV